MVNGPAFGGGLIIATACDLRFCSASASFAMSFVNLGLGPDWGGTYLLTRLVGSAKALEMLYTGERISADDALRVGLVNRIWPDSELATHVRELAVSLARKPAGILARYKRTVSYASDHTFATAADLERRHQLENFRSEQLLDGIAAFLEKRSRDSGSDA
jgi:enoyl-CoA hydratase/carnithine racemase